MRGAKAEPAIAHVACRGPSGGTVSGADLAARNLAVVPRVSGRTAPAPQCGSPRKRATSTPRVRKTDAMPALIRHVVHASVTTQVGVTSLGEGASLVMVGGGHAHHRS